MTIPFYEAYSVSTNDNQQQMNSAASFLSVPYVPSKCSAHTKTHTLTVHLTIVSVNYRHADRIGGRFLVGCFGTGVDLFMLPTTRATGVSGEHLSVVTKHNSSFSAKQLPSYTWKAMIHRTQNGTYLGYRVVRHHLPVRGNHHAWNDACSRSASRMGAKGIGQAW